ncbi:hypothetical protein H4R33_003451 [Dimargaris cristalligena]|uniref:Nucleoporin protein Ndc1-Nup n=1 Tax=Dimargaris cristalligena TaxID=215637 RepID=A0A4P9ZYX5_9FUNG|nr:hypothetical protein H4R33_003451 [Dimargaris cristalligena]RKP38887.1 nucleoporin protein Ndc1-Nup [Dimargaris cristalligena]|eukprot:RKP38887.1 nucleoporin protein Ndc1-Nup [Dimargaris cristalligena]
MAKPLSSSAATYATIDYTQICRTLLGRRWLDSVGILAGLSVCLGLLFSFQPTRGLWGSLAHLVQSSRLYSMIHIFIVLFALSLLSKKHFQVDRTVHSSRIVKLQLLARPESWKIVASYTLASFLLSGVYLRLVYHEAAVPTPLLPRANPANPLYINTSRAMWNCAVSLLGFVYGWHIVWSERLHLRFTPLHQSRFFTLKGRLPTVFANSTRFAWRFLCAFVPVYFIIHPTMTAINAFLASLDLSGTTVTPPGNPIWSPTWLIHIYLSALFMLISWEAQLAIFEVIFTEPMDVAPLSMDSNACLCDGLTPLRSSLLSGMADTLYEYYSPSDRQLVRYHAFYELARLARFSPKQRHQLFQDIDRSQTMWQGVASQCFGVLDQAVNTLQAKSAPEKTNPVLPPTDLSITPVDPLANITMRRRGAYISDLLDPALKQGNAPTSSSPSLGSTRAPAAPKSMDGYLFNLAASFLKKSKIGKELLLRVSNDASITIFADFQLQLWAIQAIGDLTYHSLREDPFGSVHPQIGRILERLVEYLILLEDFSRTPYYRTLSLTNGQANATGSSSSALFRNSPHQRLHRQAYALIQALQTTIYLIITTFYEHLAQYKFTPRCAKKLQNFVQFRE